MCDLSCHICSRLHSFKIALNRFYFKLVLTYIPFFIVWQLSDFGNGTENDTIGFFLFGNVCSEYWKSQVGTVIGLLIPTIMKQEKVG